jgi:hypothetical protein
VPEELALPPAALAKPTRSDKGLTLKVATALGDYFVDSGADAEAGFLIFAKHGRGGVADDLEEAQIESSDEVAEVEPAKKGATHAPALAAALSAGIEVVKVCTTIQWDVSA